ncbi:MAG: TPM domain-containing protein [Bacteroidota bacterium]
MKKLLLLLVLFTQLIVAQNAPEKPSNYVTDVSNTISQEQQNSLNKKLKTFEDSTSTQIFVFVSNSLNGAVLEDYTQDLFVKWKVGQKGKNNGVLITIFVNDRKFRIHTGYGVEGILPDAFTKQVQDEIMRPEFKKGDYYTGIDKGIDRLIAKSKGEFTNEVQYTTSDTEAGLIFLFILLIPNLTLWALLFTKIFKTKSSKVGISIFAGILALIPCFGTLILLIWFIAAIIKKNTSTSGGESWRTKFYNLFKNNSTSSYYSSSSYSSSGSDDSWSSSSDSDSGSSFDGGGGGDSGGGGSSSDW